MKWRLKHRLYGNKPWAVQKEGMKRSSGRDRFFYAMEMGLGKTPLTLNDFIEYRDRGDVDIMLAIAPQSFKRDWTFAPEEWGHPDIPTYLWPDCGEIPQDIETGLIAINYEAASRSKANPQIKKLLKDRKVLLVPDETSVVKNPASAVTNEILDMAKLATMVRELNGTPMTQSVMDWYPQMRIVGELNGVNRYQFKNRYAETGGFMGKQIKIGEIRNADELYRIIDRVTFRALKKDWRKDLPEQLDVPVHLEMEAVQRRHYQEMMEEFYTAVSNDMEVSADLVLTQMGKLQQISSGLAMQDGHAEWIVPPNKNPKVRAMLDLMQDGRKTIVVYQYRETGKMLTQLFRELGLEPARLMGRTDMSPAEIMADKRRFNEDGDCRVMAAQEVAACMGHTLVGQAGDRCSRMIFFENSFSLRDRLQMRDRNNRGEQDEMCLYYDLICSFMDQVAVDSLTLKKAASDMVDDVIRAVRSRQW